MSNPRPTDQNRLIEVMGKVEADTTDGDFSDLTQDDFGDIYNWLLWAVDENQLCECGQPKGSIRHSSAAAHSIDAHAFTPAKSATRT